MKRIYTILICLGVGICLIFAGISVGGLNEVSNFNFYAHGIFDGIIKVLTIFNIDHHLQ